jgi:hypothetical protein
MISAVDRARQAQAVVEILDFMRRNRLALDDLIQVGGEDFSSASQKRIEKARRVEKCWSLMARLSVKFADLEQTPPPIPGKLARRRRGEGHFSEAAEITRVSETITHPTKPNEINDLVDSASVGDPETNSDPSTESAQ